MSTSYDIHCLDCATPVPDWRDSAKTVLQCENTNFDDFRDGAMMHKILTEHRPSLEHLGGFLKDPGTWRFTDPGGPLVRLCQFLSEHFGHRLEVRDEYGRSWTKELEESP